MAKNPNMHKNRPDKKRKLFYASVDDDALLYDNLDDLVNDYGYKDGEKIEVYELVDTMKLKVTRTLE